VAEINTRIRQDSRRRIIGKKVGLTSNAMQIHLGVDQSDFGAPFDDMEFLNAEDVPIRRLIQPKVEAEGAFGVGRGLITQKPAYSEFLACLAYALPALEIVDNAIADWKINLIDTVADNASSGLYVLSDQDQSRVLHPFGASARHLRFRPFRPVHRQVRTALEVAENSATRLADVAVRLSLGKDLCPLPNRLAPVAPPVAACAYRHDGKCARPRVRRCKGKPISASGACHPGIVAAGGSPDEVAACGRSAIRKW